MSEDQRPPRILRLHGSMAALLLAWGLGVGGALPARAQDWMGMVELYGQGVVNTLSNELLTPRRIRPSGTRAEPATPAPAQPQGQPQAAPDPEALRFASSPEVSEELAGVFARTLAPALSPGRTAAELEEAIRGGQLQGAFAQALAAYGFSDQDMGDVTAGHLVMLWQVANDSIADPPRSGVLAVRKSIHEALSLAPWPRALDDAQKQTFSETLVIGTMLIVARYLHGKETQNAAVVEMARQDAKEMLASYGAPDPTRFDLTEAGLVPR
ncbi:DUF6683 family protein [Neomegalonema sp.]|uniref:DUF6683 family protein n=1 Tax=Neomegalonema sp. TaxID=2039713 RepID=UPI00261B18EC|nr:DUF6683 family protein [Neomegalonema sp.]MDD2868585.1 hypothetical protein [Neomegalonema sp.]